MANDPLRCSCGVNDAAIQMAPGCGLCLPCWYAPSRWIHLCGRDVDLLVDAATELRAVDLLALALAVDRAREQLLASLVLPVSVLQLDEGGEQRPEEGIATGYVGLGAIRSEATPIRTKEER